MTNSHPNYKERQSTKSKGQHEGIEIHTTPAINKISQYYDACLLDQNRVRKQGENCTSANISKRRRCVRDWHFIKKNDIDEK